MNLKELCTVSGQALGDVRVVTQLLFGHEPLDLNSELSPGETAIFLVHDALIRLGLTRDRCLLIVTKLFGTEIKAMIEKPRPDRLGLLFIIDSRYVGFIDHNPERELIDLETCERIGPDKMIPPVLSVTLCVSTLYLRTLARIQSRRAAEEAGQSARSSPASA